MYRVIILILIICLMPVTGICKKDITLPECFDKLDDKLGNGNKISILKKDQVTVVGYLRGIVRDTIQFSSVKRDFENAIISLDVNEIKQVSYYKRDSRSYWRGFRKHLLFGALAGFVVGATKEIVEHNQSSPSYYIPGSHYSGRKVPTDVLFVVGATVGSSLFTGLLYMIINSNTEVVTVPCGE